MSDATIQDLLEEATFDHAMGDHEAAIRKLQSAVRRDANAFEAWHALAEICFQVRQFDDALVAAQRALALRPEDLFVNTTLSRIWMEKGDKALAEKFGAKAKILGWKEALKPSPDQAS